MKDYLKENLRAVTVAVTAAATVIAFLYAAREFLIIGARSFAAVSLSAAILVALVTAYRLRQAPK